MAVTQFPDPRTAPITPEGIIALGGRLNSATLVEAYRLGIFPWPVEGLPLTWFCPPERAILEFSELHIPESLARARRKSQLRFTVDQDFEGVIRSCAKIPRPGQDGTWITPPLFRAYRDFHRAGFAHSVEAWEDDELVGGIYGVDVDGAFAGESMFHLRPNASKLALLTLIEHLKAHGLTWMDIQVLTPHLQALGARVISRDEFLEKLERTRALGLRPWLQTP